MVCAEESLANLQTSPNPRWGPEQQSSVRVIGSWCVGSDGAAEITAAVPADTRAAHLPSQAPAPTPKTPKGCPAAFRDAPRLLPKAPTAPRRSQNVAPCCKLTPCCGRAESSG